MNEEPMPADQAADAPDAQPPTPDAAPGDAADASAVVSPAALGEEPGTGTELEADADADAALPPGSDLDDEGDVAFAEDLDPETLAFGAPKPQAIVCQWCNGPLESDGLELCPHCGSRLKPTDEDPHIIRTVALETPKPVFVTADISQRRNPDERLALRESGPSD